MRSLRLQYFFTFGVMGSVMPFVSVFLQERGLSNAEIGYVIGVASFGVVLTPILITALADSAIQGRRLMAVVFVLSAVLLGLMLGAYGFSTILVLYALHSLAFAPAIPLQDGIFFDAQRRREREGLAAIPYHAVRVFGTFGYMVPAFALYFVLKPEAGETTVTPALVSGIVFGLLGCLVTFTLPPAEPKPPPAPGASRLPTVAAAKAMLEPHVLVFCAAMFLVYAASVAYYAFYPLYLTDLLGIEKRWVGLITIIGVVFEVGFMLGFGWLHAKLTLRGLIVAGILAQAVRMGLLGLFPSVAVALGTQVFHGMTVLVMHVAPPIYINKRAGAGYRNSMQGLYAMAIGGVSRITGNLVAGHVAEISLTGTFLYGAGLSVVAAALIAYAFRDEPAAGEPPPAADEDGAEADVERTQAVVATGDPAAAPNLARERPTPASER